ncbi:MAG: hypothetical protein H6636_12300 [Anaerolineales bacterium]|nr:hypothetical protein [Anaerolineales bacterium]
MTDEIPPIQSPALLTDQEVLRRLKGLIELGNQPKVAELILTQAGAFPEQIQAARQAIQQEKQTEEKEQGYLGWVIVLASFIVILVAVYLWMNWPQKNRSASVPTPVPTTASQTTDSLLNGLVQAILDKQNVPPINDDIPEPFSEYDEAGKEASCPTTPQQAGKLFGGTSGTWIYQTDANGWLFYDASANRLTIPTNMAGSVAYGSARAPQFLPVLGPAKLSNVYMAFVLCP